MLKHPDMSVILKIQITVLSFMLNGLFLMHIQIKNIILDHTMQNELADMLINC